MDDAIAQQRRMQTLVRLLGFDGDSEVLDYDCYLIAAFCVSVWVLRCLPATVVFQ